MASASLSAAATSCPSSYSTRPKVKHHNAPCEGPEASGRERASSQRARASAKRPPTAKSSALRARYAVTEGGRGKGELL
eukprot:scaffold70093_cov31-Tisochrysis_lutea.AAC.2